MKKNVLTVAAISMLSLGMLGCSFSFSTDTTNTANKTNTANTAKPANSNTSANSNAAKTSKPDDKAKGALANEKKPEGETSKKAKNNPVPENWIYIYDEVKGYGFYVPEGTTGGSDTQEGVDTFAAMTPAPSEVAIVVIAFKDKQMTKEDLLSVGVKFIEEMGATVQPGKLTGESDNYAVSEFTATRGDGGKSKGKIMVGTDVSDNYVMVLGTEEAKFAANEKIVDEIWGSFEMWSGN